MRKYEYTEDVFGPLGSTGFSDTNSAFKIVQSKRPKLIAGVSDASGEAFSYVANSGAYYDDSNVIFFVESLYAKDVPSESFLPQDLNLSGGITLDNPFFKSFNASLGLLPIKLSIKKSDDSILTINTNNIASLSKLQPFSHSTAVLCLSKNEFNSLKDLTGFLTQHERHINLKIQLEVGETYLSYDISDTQYFRYKLVVSGLDENGAFYEAEPTTPVYVYSVDRMFFTSKGFSDSLTFPISYTRNYEENIGLNISDVPPPFDGTLEDYMIGLDSNIEQIVNNFITAVNNVTSGATALNDLTGQVNQYASSLFNTAVTSVQSSFSNPDDRPLYWARIKMEVALKSHPFLLHSDVQTNNLVRIFEEKSRNYTGVDFTYANQNNLKKILITGFDPFQLDVNKMQSNPSGVCALAMHGTTIGVGYVQVMLAPVRYVDFDGNNDRSKGSGNGIVEKYIAPLIGHNTNQADMIITISQSGEGNYNIDRFATINRAGWSDNLASERESNSDSIILGTSEKDLIWIETTLPKAMAMDGGSNQQSDNWKHYVVYAQHYTLLNNAISAIPESPMYGLTFDEQFDNYTPDNPGQIFTTNKKADNLLDTNNNKKRIIEGSGSNYLSNEIFYRVALARERWQRANPSQPKFPTGHFHIAKIQSMGDLTGKYNRSNRTIYDELTKLIQTVQERITIGVNNLNNLF